METSKTYHSSHFSIRIGQNGSKKSRFSCVVSKKVSKLAVARNLLRRRFYSALSEILPEVKESYVVIFFIKSSFTTLTYDKLLTEIKQSLENAGLVKG